MRILLLPGFWLDRDSWSEVEPVLRAAGHEVESLTLRGLERDATDRAAVTLADQVDALTATVDARPPGLVLVAHSGAGAVAHAVVDRRPERIARVIYVDAGPLAAGSSINADLPVVEGLIPLPDWSVFDEESLRDLDDEARARFRARAIDEPARVARDPQVLTNEARFDVPVTLICCEFPVAQMQAWLTHGAAPLAELPLIRRVDWVDLPTGHWPQFTRPAALADVIAAAVEDHEPVSS